MVIDGPWGRPLAYILLPDHTVQPVTDVGAWATWFEESERRVAADDVGNFRVSTVFLGLDHSGLLAFVDGRKHRPVLFETMVFGRAKGKPDMVDKFTRRYCTWDEAIAGHADVVAMVKQHVGDRKKA